MPTAGRGSQEDVEDDGNSGACGNWTTDPQTGRVASPDSKKRHLRSLKSADLETEQAFIAKKPSAVLIYTFSSV